MSVELVREIEQSNLQTATRDSNRPLSNRQNGPDRHFQRDRANLIPDSRVASGSWWSRYLRSGRCRVFRYHARLGVTLSTTGTLIAALAVSVGATLVTRNIKDLPMNEVSVIQLGP